MAKTTEELKNELKSIRTNERLTEWLDENKGDNIRFCDYLNEVCDKNGIRLSSLEGKVALSKAYIYALANGTKNPAKEAVIKIALGINATVEETNQLLKLSGNKELYPKKEEDAVIEFGIQQHLTVYEIEELLKSRGLAMRLTDER
ncbi:MAG: hypothetical protein Q4C91_19400 [Eubacteriales bacterium]|nr:hypothetical protein [Eubacteriales bacterium]